MRFCLDWRRSWYFENDLSRTFQILKVLSGKTWVIFYQYFLPYFAIKSFFSLYESCFIDFFVEFSSTFFLSSRVFIHSTKKSTTKTGSTLKSKFKSTRLFYSSSMISTFYAFFYSPLFFFFLLALSSYSRASCYLFNFYSCWECFSFSLTYLQALAISLMKRLSSSIESIDRVFLRIYNFSLSFYSWLALYSSSLILSSKIKSASSIKISKISLSLSYPTINWAYASSSSSFSIIKGFSSGFYSSLLFRDTQSRPSCWLWITISHLMILSFSYWTYVSFMAWISLYLSRSDFSKCLNFRCNSLNCLVILL